LGRPFTDGSNHKQLGGQAKKGKGGRTYQGCARKRRECTSVEWGEARGGGRRRRPPSGRGPYSKGGQVRKMGGAGGVKKKGKRKVKTERTRTKRRHEHGEGKGPPVGRASPQGKMHKEDKTTSQKTRAGLHQEKKVAEKKLLSRVALGKRPRWGRCWGGKSGKSAREPNRKRKEQLEEKDPPKKRPRRTPRASQWSRGKVQTKKKLRKQKGGGV